MNKLFLFLLLAPFYSKEERLQIKDLLMKRAKSFCERHLVADDPYDEYTTKIRKEKEERNKKKDE